MSIALGIRIKYFLLAALALTIGIILQKYFSNYNILPKVKVLKKGIYFSEDLVAEDNLYLAVLGSIYDVTEGKKHYGKGSPYNYFIGKDGSRALVTGKFNDESKNKDHVLDLSCSELLTILHWRNTFKGKYSYVGSLVGRYYDENGGETSYMIEFTKRVKQCKLEKENAKKQDQLYPPCNIAWSEDNGTRVWCTKTSGGIDRSWAGVPRQLYTAGENKTSCVCVNLNNKATNMLKEYPGCHRTSTECKVKE